MGKKRTVKNVSLNSYHADRILKINKSVPRNTQVTWLSQPTQHCQNEMERETDGQTVDRKVISLYQTVYEGDKNFFLHLLNENK